jgi:hypothetical protein
MAKSFTLEPIVAGYGTRTKGKQSISDRVNQLLKRGMLQELYDKLEDEAEAFFASVKNTEREETRLFQAASIRSIAKS